MPQISYIVYGITYNSFGNNTSNIRITFTDTSGAAVSTTSNSSGKYLFDLANLTYASGDTITYVAEDEFRNESFTGNFIITGDFKNIDITLSVVTRANIVPGNRDTQIYSIGAEPISSRNPFPVQVSKIPLEDGSYALTYDSSNNLTSVVKTIGGIVYTLTLTYDSSNNLITVSKWVKS